MTFNDVVKELKKECYFAAMDILASASNNEQKIEFLLEYLSNSSLSSYRLINNKLLNILANYDEKYVKAERKEWKAKSNSYRISNKERQLYKFCIYTLNIKLDSDSEINFMRAFAVIIDNTTMVTNITKKTEECIMNMAQKVWPEKTLIGALYGN